MCFFISRDRHNNFIMSKGNMLFSQFGRNLEKVQAIDISEIIDVNNLNGKKVSDSPKKSKLYLSSLIKKPLNEKQISYPFNSIPRSNRIPSIRHTNDQSPDAKYSPKYETIQRRIPSYSFSTCKPLKLERQGSPCQQDYYTINYSSFDSGKSIARNDRFLTRTRSRTTKQTLPTLISDDRSMSPQSLNSSRAPDFSKYTKRPVERPKAIPSYDLLSVNYKRLAPRLDIGFVNFGKFINSSQIKLRTDRADAYPSIRLNYDLSTRQKIRKISLDSKLPRVVPPPPLRPKLLPYKSQGKRYEEASKELLKWLQHNQ